MLPWINNNHFELLLPIIDNYEDYPLEFKNTVYVINNKEFDIYKNKRKIMTKTKEILKMKNF